MSSRFDPPLLRSRRRSCDVRWGDVQERVANAVRARLQSVELGKTFMLAAFLTVLLSKWS